MSAHIIALACSVAAEAWSLRLLPESYTEAVCLDGSRPGYYFRDGTGRDSRNFKLHLMGGNWCSDADSCLQRSRSFLGSSTSWPAEPPNGTNGTWDLGVYGLMGKSGGLFENWTAAWIMYCDGSSFTSHREHPLIVNQTKVYLRGRAILSAVLEDLLSNMGLAEAETLALSGTSSGGMAVFYHAEHVRQQLPAATRLVAVPDAGFFPDVDCAPGQCAFRSAVRFDPWTPWESQKRKPFSALPCPFRSAHPEFLGSKSATAGQSTRALLEPHGRHGNRLPRSERALRLSVRGKARDVALPFCRVCPAIHLRTRVYHQLSLRPGGHDFTARHVLGQPTPSRAPFRQRLPRGSRAWALQQQARLPFLPRPCVFNLSSCSVAEMKRVAAWRGMMQTKLRTAGASPRHGVFASACSQASPPLPSPLSNQPTARTPAHSTPSARTLARSTPLPTQTRAAGMHLSRAEP